MKEIATLKLVFGVISISPDNIFQNLFKLWPYLYDFVLSHRNVSSSPSFHPLHLFIIATFSSTPCFHSLHLFNRFFYCSFIVAITNQPDNIKSYAVGARKRNGFQNIVFSALSYSRNPFCDMRCLQIEDHSDNAIYSNIIVFYRYYFSSYLIDIKLQKDLMFKKCF